MSAQLADYETKRDENGGQRLLPPFSFLVTQLPVKLAEEHWRHILDAALRVPSMLGELI